jgi:hypothetical protein
MSKYSVVMTGSGATSRANVEALMSDHYYANGEEGTLVLAFNSKPSQGQVWAAQQAKQQKIDVIVYANAGAFLDSISHATMVETAKPIDESIQAFKESEVFILWSDEDPDCADALAVCKTYGLASYDLCDGLAKITPADEIKRSAIPAMPESESSTDKAPEEVEEEDEEEEDEEEEETEEEEEGEEYDEKIDDIYAAVDAFIDLIVDRLAKKLKEDK